MDLIGSGAAFAAGADFASRDFRFFGNSSGLFAPGGAWLMLSLAGSGTAFRVLTLVGVLRFGIGPLCGPVDAAAVRLC